MNPNKQSVPAVSTYRDPDPGANILLYIDNSNVFESAKKYSGHKKGFINETPDFLCRIDIGKLIAKAVGDRGVLIGKLYGSEPPALDTVWDAIRKKCVHVETFRRSKVTGKEKELDTSLVADAVADIIENKEQAGENRTIILFSGDRDLLCIVDYAIKYGYCVEICSFSQSINKTVQQKANAQPNKIKIKYIDHIFGDVTYTQIVWSLPNFPLDKSIVASVNVPVNINKREFFRAFVEKSWSIFFLPMMGRYIENYRHIVLVPCVRFRRDQESNFNFYKHVQPYMHVLQEHFMHFCSQVIPLKEFLDRTRRGVDQPIIQLANRYQHLQIISDDEEDEENFFDSHYKNTSDDDQDEEEEELDENIEDNQGFQAIARRLPKPKRNLYSKPCHKKFWCLRGLKCDYKHTDEHREFFKVNPDPKSRKFYKIKPCYYKVCEYSSKSYLCPYAHDLAEARCLCCGGKEIGLHWMDQCPHNKIIKK